MSGSKEIFSFLLNEIAIDWFWRGKLCLSPHRINYRPWKYTVANQSAFAYFAYLLSWPFFVILFNVFFFIKSLSCRGHNLSELKDRRVWLDCSGKSRLVRQAQNGKEYLIIDLRSGDYNKYLTIKKKIDSLAISVCMVLASRIYLKKTDKLNMLDSYKLICFYEFVKISNNYAQELNITNHYDRWAMACFEGFKKGVTIWQHGILYENLSLPVKLKNIREIRCLSLDQISIWQTYIESPAGTKFSLQPVLFSTTDGMASVDILVISNPVYLDRELSIIQEVIVASHKKVTVAFKPHPKIPLKKEFLSSLPPGVKVLGANEFPQSAIAITHGSTLGKEYEAIGTHVFWITIQSPREVAKLVTACFDSDQENTN